MADPSVADRRVAPLVGALPPHCQQDVNTLRRFIHATVSQESPAEAVSPTAFQEVLLTGATGFVGRFFLRDLLRQKGGLVVHCLVRAETVEHGFERVRAALEQADLWDESFAPRIRIVVGDIGQARFGLSEAEFDDLCQRIDAVYHLAADLALASSYLAIRKINTLSTQSVFELCLRVRYKYVFYASSMGVFPQYFCSFANEFSQSRIDHQMQPDLTSMKKMFPLGVLGYPWSKLVVEQSLLFAHMAGLPMAIFRLPQTSLSSTGFPQVDNISMRLFSAMVDVEMVPQGVSLQRYNEPVDTLSQICLAISLNPRRRFTIYHCCDPRPARCDLEFADFGHYFREVPYGVFKRACQARGENSPLHGYWALLDHFAPYWFSDRRASATLPICDRTLREDCPRPIKWPGLLTKYARANDWVQRHRQQWPYAVRHGRLDADCLLVRAKHYAERMSVPFERAYPEWIHRSLHRLVQALNAPEARLLEAKRSSVAYGLSHLLEMNAALTRERQQLPEIEREEIARPVFIVGINRTGTTLLHRLLARDKRCWTLRSYELLEPVLPTGESATLAGTPADPRRAYLEDMLAASKMEEVFKGIHHVDIDEPEEDIQLLRLSFSSWASTVQYYVPDFGQWLAATSSRNAYAHHRRTLQHFTYQRRQRESQGQWVLKMPLHLMELETVIETYPDALFIQTHRDPTRFMGSWNSLVERVRSLSSEPRPRHDLGAEQLAFMSDMLDRAVRFRRTHPELEHRWVDVNYADLVEEPLAVVRTIYERFNWPLERAAINAMDDWLFRQEEQRQQEERHRYTLEEYGLTPEAVNTAFAQYRDFIATHGIRGFRL